MVSKQEKSLTWKYFWQQKITEVALTLLIICSLVFIPYWIGHSVGDNIDTGCNGEFVEMVFENVILTSQNYWPSNKCTTMDMWGEGLTYIIGSIGGLVLSIFLVVLIFKIIWRILYGWVMSNWENAQKRARRVVKKGRKGK